MWERYEDVVISVGGANSSLGVTSLAPSWPHQGLHVSALSEKWSLCLKGRMDLSDYFLFCFVLFFRSWDIWALKEFLQRFGAFSFVPRGSSASPPSSAMLWLAVWIQTWPVCFLLPLCQPPSLYPLFPPPFFCAFAHIFYFIFFVCAPTAETHDWLVLYRETSLFTFAPVVCFVFLFLTIYLKRCSSVWVEVSLCKSAFSRDRLLPLSPPSP